jgi:hypothetical protein
MGDGRRGAVLVCLIAAEEAATLLASAAAGVAGCAAVDRGRVIVDVFVLFTYYLALAVGLLDCEDGIGGAVGSFEGVDYADPVTDRLSVGALARVGIASGCAVLILFRTDNSLDGRHSAVVARGG